MPNFEVVIYILIIHWKESLVYFTLSCIAGILIFGSCILGDYLSRQLSRTPHRHRSQSIRSRKSLGHGDLSLLHGPGPPQKLGSWNNQRSPEHFKHGFHQHHQSLVRPSSLSLEHLSETLPSPWTIDHNGQKISLQQPQTVKLPPKQYSHTMGPGRLRNEDEDSNYNYPWVFYDAQTQQNKRVFYTQALYKKDNINAV